MFPFLAACAASFAAFSFAAFSSGVSPRESNKAADITGFVGGGGGGGGPFPDGGGGGGGPPVAAGGGGGGPPVAARVTGAGGSARKKSSASFCAFSSAAFFDISSFSGFITLACFSLGGVAGGASAGGAYTGTTTFKSGFIPIAFNKSFALSLLSAVMVFVPDLVFIES